MSKHRISEQETEDLLVAANTLISAIYHSDWQVENDENVFFNLSRLQMAIVKAEGGE